MHGSRLLKWELLRWYDHSGKVSHFRPNLTCLDVLLRKYIHALLVANFQYLEDSSFTVHELRGNLNLKYLLIYRISSLMTCGSSHSGWRRDFDVSNECDKGGESPRNLNFEGIRPETDST